MKVKKWLLGLVTFTAMVVICAVCAGAETYGNFEYSVRDDGTVEITGYSGSVEKVDIPEKIDGKSVTRIGDRAFYDCSSLASIMLPDGVTSIGDWAFYDCSSLTSITLPDGVTSIGDGAFYGCTSLASITIPDSVTEIGDFFGSVFEGCTSLASIKIPDSVTSILISTFQNCTSLKSITIPESVTFIGGSTFDGCTSLTSLVIPNSVTSIDDYAFSGCTSLTSITIPDNVTSIGDYVFLGCTSLTAINVATDNKNYVSVNGVLYNKERTTIICYPAGKKDKNYTIIDGVTSIDWEAFSGCTNLTSITIPNSVTEIGYDAFSGCANLTSITIPDSVTSIDNYAFLGCTSLTAINVATGNKNYVSVNGVLYNKDKTELICYPAEKKGNNYKILDGVKWIYSYAFDGCASLTSVTIPNSVMIINDWAFGGCTNLTAINVAAENSRYTSVNGVLYNKDKTTIKCYPAGQKGKSYSILNSVIDIEDGAFNGCTNLTSITIPDSVTNIDRRAFSGCTNLTSITIPNGVTSIEFSTFSGCISLTNVTLSDSVTSIDRGAFKNCASLKNVTIPDSVTSIGDLAFGYYYDNNENKKLDGFKIYCYPGTAGEKYAKDNGFDYELIKAEKLANVTGFKVKSLTSTNVTLQWNKNANASGYEIEQYKSGKWTNVAKITSNATTSYTVKGLAAGTAGYKFRMRAVKDGAYSDYTSVLTVNTNPYGVSGFKCSSKTSTSVTLKWNKGTTASGYQLQQYKDGKWVTIYTGTKATNTSYTVKKLKAGTAGYRFRIRAYKTYGNTKQYGSWSGEVKVNTNPYGVGGFKCSSKSSTSVTLKWNKGTTASGYQLQQYKDGKWVTIYTGTKATNTSYTVKGLKAGTAGYRFRIRAYKTYGNTKQYGSWSSEVKVNTNPYGVSGFKCSSKTSTSVTLKWNKGTTASGYQLQQYKNGKWVTIYTGTKATNTSFTVKGLKAGTAGYRFRIRAYKTYGNTKQYGSWSSEVKVNINPYGVGGFKVKATTKTSITLGWNKGTTASGYQLQQYKGGKWVTVYTGTKATSTSCTIKSLKANTSYKFRIRAYKTYGNTKQYGSWSSTLTVKTKR